MSGLLLAFYDRNYSTWSVSFGSRMDGQKYLTYIFIGQFMCKTNTLRLMLYRSTVDDGMLESLNN